MSINDCIEKEKAKVAALFEEDVELTPYDFRPSFTEFRVMAVNGQKAKHRVTVSFYDDQIYVTPKNRDPSCKLQVSDLDVRVRYGQVGNHANKVLRVLSPGHSLEEALPISASESLRPGRPESGLYVEGGTKLSLRAMLEEAYQLGGYGEHPDRRNSNGITAVEARAIAAEAIGPAARHAVERSPEGIAAAAREAAASVGKAEHGRARGQSR